MGNVSHIVSGLEEEGWAITLSFKCTICSCEHPSHRILVLLSHTAGPDPGRNYNLK